MTDSADRQTLLIPIDLHGQFRDVALARGHQRSNLVWCWLREAVKAAGQGKLLPSALSVAPVPTWGGRQLRWTQRNDEYQRWAQILRGAGSSPAAVIRAEIAAYVASGGDAADVGQPLADLIYA